MARTRSSRRQVRKKSSASPTSKKNRHTNAKFKIVKTEKVARRRKRKRQSKCHKTDAKKKAITSPFFSSLPKSFPQGWKYPLDHHCRDACTALEQLHGKVEEVIKDTRRRLSTPSKKAKREAARLRKAVKKEPPVQATFETKPNPPQSPLKQAKKEPPRTPLKKAKAEPPACPLSPSHSSDDWAVLNESRQPVLDSLWRTMLSQNTTDKNSSRAFCQFTAKFGHPVSKHIRWHDVGRASDEELLAAVRCAGLSERRVSNLRGILAQVAQDYSKLDARTQKGLGRVLSLNHLHRWNTQKVKDYLLRFKGVGAKTVSCVLLFCMGRAEFPVDVHVWRIAREVLGWAPMKAKRNDVYDHLNRCVPDDIKYALHILLVTHGKHCKRCAKNGKPQREQLGECPLVRAC